MFPVRRPVSTRARQPWAGDAAVRTRAGVRPCPGADIKARDPAGAPGLDGSKKGPELLRPGLRSPGMRGVSLPFAGWAGAPGAPVGAGSTSTCWLQQREL